MKRGLLLIALLLLFTVSTTATSLPADQIVDLREEMGTLSIVTTEPTTFWEAPDLIAGETIVADGTLTLKNSTTQVRDLTLSLVEFPFHDPAALEYLNHLHLVLRQDEDVVYTGQYSRINDGNAPLIRVTLPAGESVTYTLSLTCDYTYAGSQGLGNAIINWRFTTPLGEEFATDQTTTFSDPLLREALIAVVLLSLVLTVAVLIRQRRR